MVDEDELDTPDEFRLDRPAHHDLNFGYGRHACHGRYISRVQIPEAIKQLLKLPGFRRAAGDAGKLEFDGPFPKSMFVEYAA